jgi:hypothetical protein
MTSKTRKGIVLLVSAYQLANITENETWKIREVTIAETSGRRHNTQQGRAEKEGHRRAEKDVPARRSMVYEGLGKFVFD